MFGDKSSVRNFFRWKIAAGAYVTSARSTVSNAGPVWWITAPLQAAGCDAPPPLVDRLR